MSFWKRIFGKRNWVTIAKGVCSANRSEFFGACKHKVKAWWFIDYDEERDNYRCYYTDGDMSNPLDIKILAYELESVREVLDKYKIKY